MDTLSITLKEVRGRGLKFLVDSAVQLRRGGELRGLKYSILLSSLSYLSKIEIGALL